MKSIHECISIPVYERSVSPLSLDSVIRFRSLGVIENAFLRGRKFSKTSFIVFLIRKGMQAALARA